MVQKKQLCRTFNIKILLCQKPTRSLFHWRPLMKLQSGEGALITDEDAKLHHFHHHRAACPICSLHLLLHRFAPKQAAVSLCPWGVPVKLTLIPIARDNSGLAQSPWARGQEGKKITQACMRGEQSGRKVTSLSQDL